ncbi:DNA mismatch repair protein MutS [Eubacterium oxidoreducens]|nr:DNA mismatch repair protein MutS [Eubacterium oxidoreducens]
MMAQYMKTKEEYRDCILFYRLGDFYEMFFDDAITVSKELELTLTGKACGLEERAPMCGVPYHAAESYLNRLVSKGYKVAICEQVEDPKLSKGLVKREVIRIVTPGTNLDASMLDDGRNNFLMCIVYTTNSIGLSIADISTGEFYTTEVDTFRGIMDEIYKYAPSEIICNDAFTVSGFDITQIKERLQICISPLDDWYFNDDTATQTVLEHFRVKQLEGLGLSDFPVGTVASGALLTYLEQTQKNDLGQMTSIHPYRIGKFMIIDSFTRRNLELIETMREKQKRGSLFWVLDKTKTAMGARMLRSFIEQPLLNVEAIKQRQDAIEELMKDMISREEIREYLTPVYDLERLISRVTYQNANPRDLISFKTSLSMLPAIKTILSEFHSDLLRNLNEQLDPLEDIHALIERSIVDEPPLLVREGGIIKEGYHTEVDRLKTAKNEGTSWLAGLEEKEREKTGIKNLKIKFNKVFGYYLEVTNSYKDLVPEYYMRKQTLTNAERYITPELKEMEDTILGAQDRLVGLEYDLFCEIRSSIAKEVVRIQQTAKAIALLDVLCSLAQVAEQNNYCRPVVNEKGKIEITKGRHPVVEKMISNDLFISNDTYLDHNKKRVAIITGPNMAGKSTYMRQCALIVLMAQIGSFVPAEKAKIGIVDRIFTRVGASDDLSSGQSTFMVEMNEVANILRNATSDSLLILDEIGRGTSTFDGLSIAWAVVEHISNPKLLGAKTLFATHYHELTELEGKLDNVTNYCVAVKENGDDIVFLRKIVPGGADKSYGIQVAKLAGVPDGVIERAKQIAGELATQDITERVKAIAEENGKKETKKNVPDAMDMAQISLFDVMNDDDILEEIKELEIGNMTPVDALNKLYEIQCKINNRW